jgi:hypothetical protein
MNDAAGRPQYISQKQAEAHAAALKEEERQRFIAERNRKLIEGIELLQEDFHRLQAEAVDKIIYIEIPRRGLRSAKIRTGWHIGSGPQPSYSNETYSTVHYRSEYALGQDRRIYSGVFHDRLGTKVMISRVSWPLEVPAKIPAVSVSTHIVSADLVVGNPRELRATLARLLDEG